MNTVIWKYILGVDVVANTIGIPIKAEILTVQMQRGDVCLWVKVNPDAELEDRQFVIYGTGHAIKADNERYIGTVQIAGGVLIWHVFEKGEPK